MVLAALRSGIIERMADHVPVTRSFARHLYCHAFRDCQLKLRAGMGCLVRPRVAL